MADNITEADQLIIQLLAALNSTVGTYTASQESDNEGATANHLSLTALVVSLVALVVALLQAVLEYVSSNSAQGERCDVGAIGEYARVSGTRTWSWRHWRRQYSYPDLKLDLFNAGMRTYDVDKSEASNVFKGFKDFGPAGLENVERIGYHSWRYDPNPERRDLLPRNSIQNGRHHLYRRVEAGWALVLPQDLPMKYRLKWSFYLIFRRPRESITPRATWAQLLTFLNVDPGKVDTNHLVNAGCIPSILDVPTQKVRLTDLGILAFCLGFNTVEINTRKREIFAAGTIGTITTESMPGFGAVVRFQILSPRAQHFVAVHESENTMVHHRNQLLGSFIFPGNLNEILLPIRYDWLRSHFALDGAVLSARCSTIADEAEDWRAETAQEHAKPNTRGEDLFPEYLAAWQKSQTDDSAGGIRRWPTILLAASIACLPGITTGFPSSAFLRPFLQVFQKMTHSLSSPPGVIWEDWEDLSEGTIVLQLLQDDLCRITGCDDLIAEYKQGHFSWMFNGFDATDLRRVENILLSQTPTYKDRDSRPRGPELRQSGFQDGRVAVVQPNETSGMKAPNTDPGDCSPSLLEGRLLPYIVDLLTGNYDPRSWAYAVRNQNRSKWGPDQLQKLERGEQGRQKFIKPQNILWTQIFLLDMAICNVLNQCVGPELNASKAVAKALVDCWEDPNADAPMQSLDKYLFTKVFSDKGTEEQLEQMRALADMIKVRMLCYIAYMMIIPDSTSLYQVSLRGPVMLPMI